MAEVAFSHEAATAAKDQSACSQGAPAPAANPRYQPDYQRRRGGPSEVIWGVGTSVLVARFLVGSLNFESVTSFHGMATPLGGRRAVVNAPPSPLPPSTWYENWGPWSHVLDSPPLHDSTVPNLWPRPQGRPQVGGGGVGIKCHEVSGIAQSLAHPIGRPR